MKRSLEPARATSWLGAAGLAAALFGAASTGRARGVLVALAIAGIGLAAFLPGFVDLARWIPGLSFVRPRYGALWAALAMTLLAARGLDRAGELARRRGFVAACAGAALLVGVALLFTWPRLGEIGVTPATAARLVAAAILPLAILAVAAGAGLRAVALAAIATGGLLVEREIEMGGLYQSVAAEQFYPAVPPLDELARRSGEGRVVAIGQALYPNLATMWGLEDVRGYDPMSFGRYVDTYPIWAPDSYRQTNRVRELAPFLDLLGVRFALVPPGMTPVAAWTRLASGPGWELRENSGALPKVFVPERIRVGGGAAERLADLAERTAFRDVAWIEPGLPPAPEEAAGTPAPESPNGTCAIAVTSRGSSLHVESDCRAPAWLATSIPAWKGWRARSAVGELPLGISNHAFLAIRAGAGKSSIDLVYRPTSFLLGAATSGSALLLLGIAVLVERRRVARA